MTPAPVEIHLDFENLEKNYQVNVKQKSALTSKAAKKQWRLMALCTPLAVLCGWGSGKEHSGVLIFGLILFSSITVGAGIALLASIGAFSRWKTWFGDYLEEMRSHSSVKLTLTDTGFALTTPERTTGEQWADVKAITVQDKVIVLKVNARLRYFFFAASMTPAEFEQLKAYVGHYTQKTGTMTKQSAGILLFRLKNNSPEFFLVHPGGPFFAKKDLGIWTIPKGEFVEGEEEPLAAAQREFEEETGTRVTGEFIPLAPVKQKSGKIVHAWAVQGDIDPVTIRSNTVVIEWPPKSGKKQTIPEIDKGGWFTANTAKQKINPAQVALIDELIGKLKERK